MLPADTVEGSRSSVCLYPNVFFKINEFFREDFVPTLTRAHKSFAD